MSTTSPASTRVASAGMNDERVGARQVGHEVRRLAPDRVGSPPLLGMRRHGARDLRAAGRRGEGVLQPRGQGRPLLEARGP